MKALLLKTPLTHTAKLQNTAATRAESKDGKNRCWLHDASHLAQGDHRIAKEMERTTTQGSLEHAILEWKCLHSCAGEMHVGSAFLCNVSRALPKHPHRHVDPENFPRC